MYLDLNEFEKYQEDCKDISFQLLKVVVELAQCREKIAKKFSISGKLNYNRLVASLPFFRTFTDQLPDKKLLSLDERGYISKQELDYFMETEIATYQQAREIIFLLTIPYIALKEEQKDFLSKNEFLVEVPEFLLIRLSQIKQSISVEKELISLWKKEKETAHKYLFKVGNYTSTTFACKMLPNFSSFLHNMDSETKEELKRDLQKTKNSGEDKIFKELVDYVIEIAVDSINDDMGTLDDIHFYELRGHFEPLASFIMEKQYHNSMPEDIMLQLRLTKAKISGEFIGPFPEEPYQKRLK